jgi:hypothetical protein
MRDGALMMEAGMGSIFPTKSGSVIHASSRFAARRRDHQAVWKPSLELSKAIYDAALDSKSYKRLWPNTKYLSNPPLEPITY